MGFLNGLWELVEWPAKALVVLAAHFVAAMTFVLLFTLSHYVIEHLSGARKLLLFEVVPLRWLFDLLDLTIFTVFAVFGVLEVVRMFKRR